MEKKNKNRKNHTKKPITKQNLQDDLDFVFNDLKTVDSNNDRRLDDLIDLETVDYNNDTSITDLVPTKNFKQLKKKMMKKMDYRL